MQIQSKFGACRRNLADSAFSGFHKVFSVDADEITRLSGWMCFLSAGAILFSRFDVAIALLIVGLLADAMDGAYARMQGKDNKQIDWAKYRKKE